MYVISFESITGKPYTLTSCINISIDWFSFKPHRFIAELRHHSFRSWFVVCRCQTIVLTNDDFSSHPSEEASLKPWWRHQMETFSALLAIFAGISPLTVDFPHKGQWRETLMFYFICAWISGWSNNREADDLRHRRAHYVVTVMQWLKSTNLLWRNCN